jgi:hypothetical protein
MARWWNTYLKASKYKALNRNPLLSLSKKKESRELL